ncbi:pyocin activator PrtN family protein [Chromohalobacter canadensis]|uniref:pyocin activator PrtN family protein n=1 Tax=Chromohalobacter canadensis TaxID=141389 RepID=UPI003C6C1218|nr:pyocin activator PrtN family protein [Chromohalobacter canadensis]MCT8470596.1 pyocin activator PrtN family protein [Chromohalobacter canadensis]MCT8498153.1 pyocin activator PrtN family protein [Chromohalobacter canadensis]
MSPPNQRLGGGGVGARTRTYGAQRHKSGIAEFDGRAELPLEGVATRYFGISARTAGMRAGAQALTVPAYRAGDSQKAPWLVSAVDLASYWIRSGQRRMGCGAR